MSIQNNFPAIRPSLLLDFAKVQALDPRVTLTRASTATFTNSLGLIQTAASGVPRFDFNPLTDECNGLLIEEQRTNLLRYSNDFSNAIWTSVSAAVVKTQNLTGPDGVTNSAWTLDDQSTGSDGAAMEQIVSITPSSTTQYTCSFWVKQGTALRFAFLMFFTGSSTKGTFLSYTWATNNLSVGPADGGGITPTVYGRVQYPNGWSRFYVVISDANSGLNTNLQFRMYPAGRDAGGVVGTCGYYGAQIEVGAFPTSYIPTVASQVTRAADVASMTGTNFFSWYNAAEGTIYGEYIGVANVAGATRRLVEIGIAATTTDRFVVGYSQTNNTRFLVVAGGATQADISASATQGSVVKFAGAYAFNNFQQATNATLGIADTSATIPLGINAMAIGADFGPTANTVLNGTIRKIAYYPIRCTNAQLQALTS